MSDPINPPHYKAGGIETIDAIEAACAAYGPAAFLGLLVGNVIKYVSRAPLKGRVEDLRKARWYLDRLIAAYEAQDEARQATAGRRAALIEEAFRRPTRDAIKEADDRFGEPPGRIDPNPKK